MLSAWLTFFACTVDAEEPATATSTTPTAAQAPALHGQRPATRIALPVVSAHAQDGSPRDAQALLGHKTVLWFFPSAGTYG